MIRWLFISLCMILLAGCQTALELSGLGPEAKTRVGQLLYTYGGHSIVGDIVLRSLNGGDYDLYSLGPDGNGQPPAAGASTASARP